MNKEFYFTLNLTENEHDIVQCQIQEFCDKYESTLIYYRKFKNGHVLCYRECKVSGNVHKLKKFLKDNNIKIDNINA